MEAEAFLKMDIFFFVSTVVVGVVGILGILFFYYLVRIVRDISDITKTVKKEAKEVADDFKEVRSDIKTSVHAVKRAGTTIVGAGIVRGISNLFDAISEEKEEGTKRKTRKKASKKK